MITPIHTEIITVIQKQLKKDSRFSNLTATQNQRLVHKLINVWYFIYARQQMIILTKQNEEINWNHFVNIHYHELKNKYKIEIKKKEYGHPVLIDILEAAKLVIVNEKFSMDNFSKSYKVNTSFLANAHFTPVDINFKAIFKNTRNKEHWLNIYPDYAPLIEDVYASTIDLDDYLYWLRNNVGIDLKKTKRRKIKLACGKTIIKTEKQYLTAEKIGQHFFAALRLNFQNVWFAVSDEGRFYNSVSNIPSTAVRFLKMSGEDTFNVDISNSQPLLLSVLLSDKQKVYKNDVQNGVFYQKVADFMGCERSYFKGLSYQFVFFNDKLLKSGMVFDALEAIYPGLIHEINQIKTNSKLACRLQAMESDIFVNRIGKLEFPKLLRHDQVIVTEEHFEIVQQELVKEYKNLGLKVTF